MHTQSIKWKQKSPGKQQKGIGVWDRHNWSSCVIGPTALSGFRYQPFYLTFIKLCRLCFLSLSFHVCGIFWCMNLGFFTFPRPQIDHLGYFTKPRNYGNYPSVPPHCGFTIPMNVRDESRVYEIDKLLLPKRMNTNMTRHGW